MEALVLPLLPRPEISKSNTASLDSIQRRMNSLLHPLLLRKTSIRIRISQALITPKQAIILPSTRITHKRALFLTRITPTSPLRRAPIPMPMMEDIIAMTT